MEDIERDAAFDNIKQATLARIFGNMPQVEVPEVEKRIVDFKFGKDVSWMDQPRMTGNNDNTGWDEINKRIHRDNGHLELGKRFAPCHRTKKIRWTPAQPES